MISKEFMLALSGELEAHLENADRTVLLAARKAIIAVTEHGEARMEAMVRQARLGKLEKAVTSRIYPKSGLARNPSSIIYVRPSAMHIFESFEEGATIRGKLGGMLTIPIPGSPADRQNFGKDPSGKTRLDWFKAKGIAIKYVPGRLSRPAMLVAEDVRLGVRGRTGRSRLSKAARRKDGSAGKGAQMVPLFWLIEEANMPKRLSWSSEARAIGRSFLRDFATHFAQEVEALQA